MGHRNLRQIALPFAAFILWGIYMGMLGLAAQGEEQITFSREDRFFWFKNSEIQLRFDQTMQCKVFYDNGTTVQSITEESPSHFIVVDGEEIKSFAVESTSFTKINTEFGRGKRLILKGVSTRLKKKLRKILTVELYNDYPNVAITYAGYENVEFATMRIDKIFNNYYQLDASLVDKSKQPWEFWSFLGAASESWANIGRPDYIREINKNTDLENYMGMRNIVGGGVPLIDLWCRQMGMALAHLETVPIPTYFPVRVEDEKVTIAERTDGPINLPDGESFTTIKTVVIVHSLDYFDALRSFVRLMEAQGLKMKEPNEECYEPIWCGWGYGLDFTVEDILGVMPKLKEFDIHWVVIDDRWFDKYGDWNPRETTFPDGEAGVKRMVDTLHKNGFLVKIWWLPANAEPDSKLAAAYPELLIKDREGEYPLDKRQCYFLCPSLPQVQEYTQRLTERFIKGWDFDGHKLDAFYECPPCYAAEHNHPYPVKSFEDFPKIVKIIYDTTIALKPSAVVEVCNCGTVQDFYQQLWINQPATSDPANSWNVRTRIKVFKALIEPRCPAYADLIEQYSTDDFASAVGPGGVIGTKFTWPDGPAKMRLTEEKEKHWGKWINIYKQHMLSKGEYLNLYDVIYDKPEMHVVKRGDTLYYAIYADGWNGEIQLRGLQESRTYAVTDYVNDARVGKVTGPDASIAVSFEQYLLLKCAPVF